MGTTRGGLGWAVVVVVAVLAAGCSGDKMCSSGDPGCGGPPAPACGDRRVDAGEGCDDGNTTSGDGCSASCTVEAGFTCAGTPSVCDTAPPAGVVVVRCATLADPGGGTCRVTPGGAALLLEGTVLLPGRLLRGGQVAVDAAGLITCVGCDCAAGAAGATRVTCPGGVLSPGLVNALDRLAYSQNAPHADGGERYEHRHDWRLGQGGHTVITVVGGASAAEQQWTELRQVLAGTTSVVGSGGVAGLLRNLDRASLREGLAGPPASMVAFPLGDQAGTRLVSGCAYPNIVTPASLVADPAAFLDAAEGVDASAAHELACLTSTASGGQDLLAPQVALVGAVAAGPVHFAQLAERGTALVWTPRSNVSLYGDTVRVTVAARAGVELALGTDWSISGSSTPLRELACADQWNRERLAGFFSDEQLWRMATRGAAGAAGVADQVGELAAGRQADLVVFAGQAHRDYRAALDAGPADVTLVLRGGRVLHGDAALVAALEGTGCEPVEVCGVAKRTCLQRELGTTFAALASANASRPPAIACGAPAGEPTCIPSRSVSVAGSSVYSGAILAGDADGDGIPDALDACPDVFDPVRPQDGGSQADLDGDGVGDACDPCPLVAGSLACLALASLAPGP